MARNEREEGPATAGEVGGRGRTDDRLLTADELAAMLQVTRGWVYAEARAGRLPHIRLGHYVRFRDGAIRRWLELRERESLEPVTRGRLEDVGGRSLGGRAA